MTIAVAVKKGNRIALAADSQENFGSYREVAPNHAADKILKLGSWLIATSGWGVYGNILQDYAAGKRCPASAGELEIFRFFLRFWKDLHERYPFVNDQSNHDDEHSPFGDLDAEFLVITRAGIFKVCSDTSVTQFHHYCAVGSGGDYAMGALYALYESDLDAEALARRAVETAIRFDLRCGGEIDLCTVRLARTSGARRKAG